MPSAQHFQLSDEDIDLEMPAGESARSPIGESGGQEQDQNQSQGDQVGDEIEEETRKRSASPSSAQQLVWDHPPKKFCAGEGINIDDWVQTTANDAVPIVVPDMSGQYKENYDMLVQMGFQTDEIDLALRLSNNELEKAVQYLTREIIGLDTTKPTTSMETRPIMSIPDLLHVNYSESDEEEVPEAEALIWPEKDVKRVRSLLDPFHRHIFYRKNGSLARCMTVARNLLNEKPENWRECVFFVDETLYFILTTHVNSNEVYMGDVEIGLVEEFYRAVIPVMCARMTCSPVSVKLPLMIDELFNQHNRFFTIAAESYKKTDRVFHPSTWCDLALLEKLESKHLYAELVDEFVQFSIVAIDQRMDSPAEEPPIDDVLHIFRSMNSVTGVLDKNNGKFLERVEVWVSHALKRIGMVTDKEIRDAQTRRQGLDVINEVVLMCERVDFDVFSYTQEARMEFLKRMLKCPQMECMLHALEELGYIADKMGKSLMQLARAKMCVSESYFKKWLDENKVLQIVLTGNMDSALYVERVQPILQYMTPELTLEEMKFIWSLRKGRLGVSMDNFNKIMEMILRSISSEQMEWVMELFKKSFRSREVRLFESMFNFCATMATQKDRDDECKLRIANTVWELIAICRGPPLSCPFKSIEVGMRRHCEIMNAMYMKGERDTFVVNIIDGMKDDDGFTEVNVVYLYLMLEKLRRLYFPRRMLEYSKNDEAVMKAHRLRELLRERRLFELLIDRMEHIRNISHQVYDAATMNSLISANQESMSNAQDATNDPFSANPADNILTTPLFGCTDYGFLLQSTLKLMRWLHDNDAVCITIELIERIFDIFVFSRNATQNEKSEIFLWLTDLKTIVQEEAARSVLSMMCKMDVFTLQISALKCFSRFLEDLPNIYNENDENPIEGHVMKRMTDCKLFLWKLILFNESDEVVNKCIEAFCERELISVESPRFVKLNTLHFLSVFVFYVEQLKKELCSRSGKVNIDCHYDSTELEMGDEEIKQHEIPLDTLLTESVTRAIDRLIRFLTRFVELGNEKNNMIRQFPSHGSCISGHTVKVSIELRNEEDDFDCFQSMIQWKSLVCDSNTTIGEFKVRLAKRLVFHENITEFTVQKTDDDMILQETSLRYDYLTLQSVHLATESESIFYSEKFRILVKPRSRPSRKFEPKKAIHEMYLPAAIVSCCNFYNLFHELSSIGDKHVRNSVRNLLLLLPTQPSLLQFLTSEYVDDDAHLVEKLQNLCDEFNPCEPWKFLYSLETISSILAPTRLTPASCEGAKELSMAVLKTNMLEIFMEKILRTPNEVPLNKCSQRDRHSIFERIVQIMRIVYVGKSTMLKSIVNENLTRNEMKVTADRLFASRQGTHTLDPPVDYVLVRQGILPDGFRLPRNKNNPLLACDREVIRFEMDSKAAIKDWTLDQVFSLIATLRDYIWIHVATESQISKPVVAFHEVAVEGNEPSASDLIRSATRHENDRRLVIVRKVLSTIRLIICRYVEYIDRNSVVRLLAHMFMKSTWISFYQDVLVNSYQEAYRKYMEETLVKMAKDNNQIASMILKMLLDIFTELPFHKGHTAGLGPLQKRQRQHCDVLVHTVQQILLPFLRKPISPDYMELDWSRVGHSPIVVLTGQVKSLMDYKPRFSSTNFELQQTEISYSASKMKMINCLLPFCTQEQTEGCAQEFLKVVMSKFLFPEQLDIEELMFEEESTRWESYCRDAAIFTVTMFCERSYKNMKIVLQDLEKFPIFHRDYDANYKACITPRNFDQVGMKNDGGTCYMNATIQQLVHVPGLAQKLIAIQNIDPTLKCGQATAALLSEVQKLFATLVYSRAQYCFPVGLWNEFRFDPDVPLNTKQHHDAIDFYSILLDHCDSVLKKMDCPQLFKEHLFGKYSYEKICYGCWHRYKSPDEEFNCVSLALHGDNLEEALDNFLEPHLMEGENAYHCEKCNEKKTTLNRGSFLELPPTLTIQLKRFTYDFINNSIQKDNQFFKFPFEIDMQPYTTNARHVPDEHVQDLFDEMLYSSNEDPKDQQRRSNGSSDKQSASSQPTDSPQKKLFRRHRSSTLRLSQSFASMSNEAQPTLPPKPLIYELVGVMAHSGGATAGHYYSFVKERREEMKDSPSYGKWFNLNDQYATPLNMQTVAELWFGGSFSGENSLIDDRTRHWNAYVLFYDKKKDESDVDMVELENIENLVGRVKEKVSFDITDEIINDGVNMNGENEIEINGDGPLKKKKKKMSEARNLRIRMFNSMDNNLREYLNNEHSRFLLDRDFFSHDLYYVYVNSCLQLLRNQKPMDFLFDETREAFITNAYNHCFGYISRVSWPFHGACDHKPKQFPKNSVELMKKFMYQTPMIKIYFMNAIENNELEIMTRILESTDQDVRHAFWVTLRCALRLWCLEKGQSPGARPVLVEASPDSTDIEEDDEEEEDEEEELDDEDTESEGDLIAAGDASIMHRLSRPVGIVGPIVHGATGATEIDMRTEATIRAVCEQVRVAGMPLDYSISRNARRMSTSSSVEQNIANLAMVDDSDSVQRNIMKKICHYIQIRMLSRHLVECILLSVRANQFGLQFVLSCKILDYLADFMFEDLPTGFARLRLTEHRMKSCGLWPGLPTLYFELLYAHLERMPNEQMDQLMRPKLAADLVAMYCSSREEAETNDRNVDDARSLHNRILDCFCSQITNMSVDSASGDAYIFHVVQVVLKEMTHGSNSPLSNENHWLYAVKFFAELALQLHSYGNIVAALRVIREVLNMSVGEDETMVHCGLLPEMLRWMKFDDVARAKKMYDALAPIRRIRNPDIRKLLMEMQEKFPTILHLLEEDFKSSSRRVRACAPPPPNLRMEDEEGMMIDGNELILSGDGDLMIGPQPLRRARNTTNLTKEDEAIATARVVEIVEIKDLAEHLAKNPAPK